MKIKQVNLILSDPNMQDKECNFKVSSKKPKAPAWFTYWVDNVYKRDQHLIISHINQLDKRIDNLIKKNNLAE